MKLEVISPESTLFTGEVELVTLPSILGSFTVLPKHAPVVSVLQRGFVVWKEPGKDKVEWEIEGGFVELKNDLISVCIDGLIKSDE